MCPARRQYEQLHTSADVNSPSTSKATFPQWQLPACVVIPNSR
jgi:hypothetical protein